MTEKAEDQQQITRKGSYIVAISKVDTKEAEVARENAKDEADSRHTIVNTAVGTDQWMQQLKLCENELYQKLRENER